MPKRVVDGDAVWRSKKLKQMSPQFRAEYANLVPLAEANGVFEMDVDRVWSDVYSYNREDVTVETVAQILTELEEVGLLRVWKEDGKTWGYWEGIHKSGRLPKASELLKYKNLPPNPPPQTSISGDSAEDSRILSPRFGIGLVLDRSGLGEEPQDENTEILETLEQDGQEEMKLKKEIQAVCAGYGVNGKGFPDTWEQMSALEIAHSRGAVVRDFTEFMSENRGDDFPRGAVSAYLRTAYSRLSEGGTSVQSAAKAPEVQELVRTLSRASGGQIDFLDKHRARLGEVLKEFTAEEITTGFKNWLADQDEADLPKFGAGKFAQVADSRADAVRISRIEKQKAESEREAAKIRLQEEAESERKKIEAEKLVEENLDDPLNM